MYQANTCAAQQGGASFPSAPSKPARRLRAWWRLPLRLLCVRIPVVMRALLEIINQSPRIWWLQIRIHEICQLALLHLTMATCVAFSIVRRFLLHLQEAFLHLLF